MKSSILGICLCCLALLSSAETRGEQIQFIQGGIAAAKSRAVAEGKLFFAVFYTDWCLPCKWMDENTFRDHDLAVFANGNYLAVKVNIDDFDGHAQRQQYNVEFLPTIIVFDQGGGILGKYEESLSSKRLLEALQSHRFDMANKSIKLSSIPSKARNENPPASVAADQGKPAPAQTKEREKEREKIRDKETPANPPAVANNNSPRMEKAEKAKTEEPKPKDPPARPAETTQAASEEKKVTSPPVPDKPVTPPAAQQSSTATESGKYYSVQVGTFSRFENADVRRNEFKEIFGDGVHIKIEKSGADTIYKVMIGRYKTYDAAKPLVSLLKEQGYEGFVKEVSQN